MQMVQETFADLGTSLAEVTFVVVDLETTGGSPAGSQITEIGAVKVRGGWAEPDSIAQVLRRHPSVSRAVVVPETDARGRTRLLAFAIAAAAATPRRRRRRLDRTSSSDEQIGVPISTWL